MERQFGITWEADTRRAPIAGGDPVHVHCEATARVETDSKGRVTCELLDVDYWIADSEGVRWHVTALEEPIYAAGYAALDALLAGEADAARGAA